MAATFAISHDPAAFKLSSRQFASAPDAPIPVWAGGRSDIEESVARAEQLYAGRRIPDAADVGVWLGDDVARVTLAPLILPLARQWVSPSEILRLAVDGSTARILLIGVWFDLADPVVTELRSVANHRRGCVTIGVLTGRDLISLGWLAARQWASIASEVRATGFFSAIDRPDGSPNVDVYSEADFETKDMLEALTGRPWRKLFVQGHGKDDNINLGPYTLCGRSTAGGELGDALRPRCGYGDGHCFKDDEKVIPLQRVPAAEITLSSCYAAVLPPYQSYGSEYQLVLAAVDGSAQTIVGGMGMHDSDAPENDAWLSAAESADADIGGVIDASLADISPMAEMLHVGLPPHPSAAPDRVGGVPARVAGLADRLMVWRGSTLLAVDHPLRPRLDRLATKLDRLVSRRGRALVARHRPNPWRELWSDAQSVDHALASRMAQDPREEAANFDTHFAGRSRLIAESVERRACHCGAPAMVYRRTGIAGPVPATLYLHCPQCGYRVVAMEAAPDLTVCADPECLVPGGSLSLIISVTAAHEGPIKIAVNAPAYVRNDLEITPAVTTAAVKPGRPRAVTVRVHARPNVPPQGYYVMVFAIQDLAIAACRQSVGIAEGVETPTAAPPGEAH